MRTDPPGGRVRSEHGDVERGGCAAGVGVVGGHLDALPVRAAACDGAEGVADAVAGVAVTMARDRSTSSLLIFTQKTWPDLVTSETPLECTIEPSALTSAPAWAYGAWELEVAAIAIPPATARPVTHSPATVSPAARIFFVRMVVSFSGVCRMERCERSNRCHI